MLTQIFLYCLAVSVWGALLILMLWALRPVTSRFFGVKWQYYSCLPVILVLLLPLFFLPVNLFGEFFADFADKFNITSALTAPQPETDLLLQENAWGDWGPAGQFAQLKEIPNEEIAAEQANISIIGIKQNIFFNVLKSVNWHFMAIIWLIVAISLLFGRLLVYRCFRQYLLKNSVVVSWHDVPLTEPENWQAIAPKLQLRQQLNEANEKPWLAAPFVTGLRQPCLLLPAPALAAELTNTDWQNLLRHELTHYQRHDLFYKWLLLFGQCLHWFNPLVYLFGHHFEQDCEVSCDLAVTGSMNENERRDYMRTILRMLRPVPLSSVVLASALHTSMSSDKGKIKRRFEMISKNKINGRYWRGLATFCSVLLMMLALGGSALAAAQTSGLELFATAQTVDDGVVWGVAKTTGLYNVSDGIVVYNNGKAVNFTNKPFLSAEGAIYLPLRETLEEFQIIEPNDNSSLQYENGLVKLALYQWQEDAAGGRVLHCFYQRQFSLTDKLVGAQMHNDVIYVPAEMLLGIAQMSAAGGSSMLDGLMILQYDKNGGEILRLLSLPLPSENKTVHTTLPLPEQFAVVTQFLQAWQQSDYQKMQSFCTQYVWESVGWAHADVMLGEARAVYAEQLAAEPNSLALHVLIIRPDGSSGYSELALGLEVEQQQNGEWLISSLRSSNRDNTPLSDESKQYWQWPLDSKYHILSAGFGGKQQHSGIDIPAVTGTPVYAAAAGQVLAAGYMGADGNKIILQHPSYGDWETRYSHLASLAVQAGDVVTAGQIIGYVGSTGQSTGAHLHFSILQNGQPLDPLNLLAKE